MNKEKPQFNTETEKSPWTEVSMAEFWGHRNEDSEDKRQWVRGDEYMKYVRMLCEDEGNFEREVLPLLSEYDRKYYEQCNEGGKKDFITLIFGTYDNNDIRMWLNGEIHDAVRYVMTDVLDGTYDYYDIARKIYVPRKDIDLDDYIQGILESKEHGTKVRIDEAFKDADGKPLPWPMPAGRLDLGFNIHNAWLKGDGRDMQRFIEMKKIIDLLYSNQSVRTLLYNGNTVKKNKITALFKGDIADMDLNQKYITTPIKN